MENIEEKTNLTGEKWRNPDGTLREGHPGLPNAGRPKGKTFRDYFSETEEADLIVKVKEVLKDRPEILKMAIEQIFGKPRQNIGLDGGEEGKSIIINISKEIAEKNELNSSSSDNSEGQA